ncbi:cytochrome c-type biogenesis protein [Hyphomicrobium sp.]|uniref:cytochrome c-type biogenesis protein n=1 Tax=Hyphomicrobium sp. TaxID=82 RepID=UPI002FE052CD
MRTRGLALAVLIVSLASSATAGVVREEDPGEQRLKAIAADLRCPVCQGESIYDSHSTVAGQMKALIREQVSAGRSDDEIKSFFVDRYGEFILMEPRASWRTALVWVFPGAAFFGGAAIFFLLLRRRMPGAQPAAVSAADVDSADLINRIERLEP